MAFWDAHWEFVVAVVPVWGALAWNIWLSVRLHNCLHRHDVFVHETVEKNAAHHAEVHRD